MRKGIVIFYCLKIKVTALDSDATLVLGARDRKQFLV